MRFQVCEIQDLLLIQFTFWLCNIWPFNGELWPKCLNSFVIFVVSEDEANLEKKNYIREIRKLVWFWLPELNILVVIFISFQIFFFLHWTWFKGNHIFPAGKMNAISIELNLLVVIAVLQKYVISSFKWATWLQKIIF
jgi:hypothetical protein